MVNVFAVPVFFVVFREALETSIIVSVLLAFLNQTLAPEQDRVTYKKLVRQVWAGTGLGFLICLVIGAGMIGAFYTLGQDHWAGTEDVWEGAFALIATVIISLMGAALLRVSKLQDKWRVKLAKAMEAKHVTGGTRAIRLKRWAEKYAMFMLPFITVLREGLEAVVFVGGVSVGQPASSFPIPAICGLAAGCLVGYLIYRGGKSASIQICLIISTCILYLVAAGLFSKAVGYFEGNKWNKIIGGNADEAGDGPGSYDIRQSVWHVNCCSPKLGGGGGWGIFNALLGWTNSATYGTVISYNLYWLCVIIAFLAMRYNEKVGHWPFIAAKSKPAATESSTDGASSDDIDSIGARGDGVVESSVEKPKGAVVATHEQIA